MISTNSSLFVNTFGALDIAGRAQARFSAPAGLLLPAANGGLDFAYVLIPFNFASNPVGVWIER